MYRGPPERTLAIYAREFRRIAASRDAPNLVLLAWLGLANPDPTLTLSLSLSLSLSLTPSLTLTLTLGALGGGPRPLGRRRACCRRRAQQAAAAARAL